MKKTFAFGAATAQGTWPTQEDGYFADPVRGIFALADGFGGRGAGDMAAKAALQEVRGRDKRDGGGKWLAEVFGSAHSTLLKRNSGRPAASRGGSSLAVLSIEAEGARVSQCGACAAWLFRDGIFQPLLLPQASLREEFQSRLPDQALGVGAAPVPEQRIFSPRSGDILFLASSGIEFESESFRHEAAAQLLARLPGADLSDLTQQLVQNSGSAAAGWNRTVLAVELF